jgi:hypothetical protein
MRRYRAAVLAVRPDAIVYAAAGDHTSCPRGHSSERHTPPPQDVNPFPASPRRPDAKTPGACWAPPFGCGPARRRWWPGPGAASSSGRNTTSQATPPGSGSTFGTECDASRSSPAPGTAEHCRSTAALSLSRPARLLRPSPYGPVNPEVRDSGTACHPLSPQRRSLLLVVPSTIPAATRPGSHCGDASWRNC